MTTRLPRGALAPTVLSLLAMTLVACSSAASQSPIASASASVAASPSVAPTVEPSTVPSTVPSEEPAPSTSTGPLPSFSLPSDDKELEALLPDQLCGAESFKLSLSGAGIMENANPEFVATLETLGKSPDDVAFAVAGGTTPNCDQVAGVFRIKGADAAQLQQVFLSEAAKQGAAPPVSKSLGGRTVYEIVDEGENPTYAYFGGDAIFFVAAATDADAEALLTQMP